MGPADRGHEVGVRVAITAGVPLLLVFFLDRMDLALYVTFGSMAGIYGRGQQHGPRLRSQLRAGVLMLVVLAAATVAGQMGVSETADPWGLVWTTSLVSGFCALMCGLWSLRPGGSLFHIFAFAAVASVPFKPAPLEGMLTALAVVVWAMLIGVASRVHPGRRHRIEWHRFERPDPERLRIIGTFLGLLVTGLVVLLNPPPLALLLIVVALQAYVETFVARQYMLAMIGVTPMALLSLMLVSVTAGGAESLVAAGGGQTLADRFVETTIGAAVGVACVLFPLLWRKLVRRSPDAAVEAR